VSPIPTKKGPAIEMDIPDHMKTASWGSGAAASQYRATQRTLIESGRFDDAIVMDIDDIRSQFGGKYDDAILELIDSLG